MSSTESRTDPRLLRAALGTATVFGLSGGLGATWLSRLPSVRDHLQTDTGSLGLALLCMGLGSIMAMPLTGTICARRGSRQVVAATATGSAVSLVTLAFVPTVVVLGLLLLCLGACYGAWDVAMNLQGSHVERLAGRQWMPRYHACWSVGAIVGAGLGALAAWLGIGLALHFACVAVLVVSCVAVALRTFVDERVDVLDEPDHEDAGRFVDRRLVLIGLITLCGTCIEGSAGDWLGLHLHDDLGASTAVAAAGYAVFAGAMMIMRFAGPPVLDTLGRVTALRGGGVVAGAGVLVAAYAPAVPLALGGAVLWGLGVALVFPATMSAGGETPGHSAGAIATVATIGYGGFLLGPPLIGLLGRHVGLDRALLVLLVLAAAIVVLAAAARPVVSLEGSG